MFLLELRNILNSSKLLIEEISADKFLTEIFFNGLFWLLSQSLVEQPIKKNKKNKKFFIFTFWFELSACWHLKKHNL